MVDEVILGVEELLTFVVDVEGQLVVAIGAFLELLDVPALVQAEADREHDQARGQDQEASHCDDQCVVRP